MLDQWFPLICVGLIRFATLSSTLMLHRERASDRYRYTAAIIADVDEDIAVDVDIDVGIDICVYIYVCVYIYIYIYTHIHTYITYIHTNKHNIA